MGANLYKFALFKLAKIKLDVPTPDPDTLLKYSISRVLLKRGVKNGHTKKE